VGPPARPRMRLYLDSN